MRPVCALATCLATCPVICLHLLHYRFELLGWPEREAVEQGVLECPAGRHLPRLGPVHTRQIMPVMSAVGILFVAHHNARVEEGTTNRPQHGRDLARWEQVVDVYRDFGSLQ